MWPQQPDHSDALGLLAPLMKILLILAYFLYHHPVFTFPHIDRLLSSLPISSIPLTYI
jgi:hypothetical protein